MPSSNASCFVKSSSLFLVLVLMTCSLESNIAYDLSISSNVSLLLSTSCEAKLTPSPSILNNLLMIFEYAVFWFLYYYLGFNDSYSKSTVQSDSAGLDSSLDSEFDSSVEVDSVLFWAAYLGESVRS